MAELGGTLGIVMLLPANRVEQKWWQEHVEPYRDRPDGRLRVRFLPGRMRFERPGAVVGPKGDRPPFGCCLLIFTPRPEWTPVPVVRDSGVTCLCYEPHDEDCRCGDSPRPADRGDSGATP